MDFSLIIEHGPVIGAALVSLLGAAWVAFKAIAAFTKTKADDAFIAEHGAAIEGALDTLEGKTK